MKKLLSCLLAVLVCVLFIFAPEASARHTCLTENIEDDNVADYSFKKPVYIQASKLSQDFDKELSFQDICRLDEYTLYAPFGNQISEVDKDGNILSTLFTAKGEIGLANVGKRFLFYTVGSTLYKTDRLDGGTLCLDFGQGTYLCEMWIVNSNLAYILTSSYSRAEMKLFTDDDAIYDGWLCDFGKRTTQEVPIDDVSELLFKDVTRASEPVSGPYTIDGVVIPVEYSFVNKHTGLPESRVFTNGIYFNHSNEPCAHHGNCSYNGGCDCIAVNLSIQCYGFAHMVHNKIWGEYPEKSIKTTVD